ncbi:MAG: MgtC/SapB family protein [Clostridiales bacterium]|nr:MgtC/SapB family protein [Clostridiales bacterium]
MSVLNGFNLISVTVRLLLAMTSGGLIGYGREKKERNAGLRTYMLISIGAALTVLISIYDYDMLTGLWEPYTHDNAIKFDAMRYAAQVLAGIGFLAAGTILASRHQQVSGLTSAIGLFAAAVLGIASGAGFYICVIPAILLIVFSMEVLQPLEVDYKRRLRNITITVRFRSLENTEDIKDVIEGQGAKIYDIDIENDEVYDDGSVSAIFSMKMSKEQSSHSEMLSSIAELPCVISLHELIS